MAHVWKRTTLRILTVSGGLLSLGLLAAFIPRLITEIYARPRLVGVSEAPTLRVAIVFGAGLRRDGTPSPVLRDRVATAAELYFSGKVEKLLMSGDNRVVEYNEPGAMQAYALSLGIPGDAIVLDYAGRSTYETCFRARAIFAVEEAILVTQKFHLPRALYTCRSMGISAVGVPAAGFSFRNRSSIYWNGREVAATLAAFWELHVTQPLPVLGTPEPIFPQEGT